MRIVDGKEVPMTDGFPLWGAPVGTLEELDAIRAKLAAHDALEAEHDRLLYTYFRTYHWARGLYLAVLDKQQLAEQFRRQYAASGGTDTTEHVYRCMGVCPTRRTSVGFHIGSVVCETCGTAMARSPSEGT